MKFSRIAVVVLAFAAAALALGACSAEQAAHHTAAPTTTPRATAVVAPGSPQACPNPRRRPAKGTAVADPKASSLPELTFTPTYVVACRYGDLPNTSALVGSATILAPAAVARIATELNSFVPIPLNAIVSCPADSGGTIVLYVGSPTQQVVFGLATSGCGFLAGPRGSYSGEKTGDLLKEMTILTATLR